MVGDAALLELVDLVYAAALDSGAWEPFLERLGRRRGAAATLFLHDYRTPGLGFVRQVGFSEEAVRTYGAHYAATNVWMANARHAAAGEVLVGHGIVDPRDLERTEFYNDWLRPNGIRDSLGGVVLADAWTTVHLSLLPRGRDLVDEDDVRLLRRLVPHVQRAVRVHRRLQAAEVERDGMLRAFERQAIGFIICDGQGRLQVANPEAERLLHGGGLCVAQGRLRAGNGVGEALARALARATAVPHAAGSVLRVPRPDAAALSVLVCPFRGRIPLIGGEERLALLFVTDPERCGRLREEHLTRLYGLTAAEGRLLLALLQGRRLAEHAAAAGVSITTVRSQLQSIFAKTGVGRQADLVRHVLADPISGLAHED